MRLRVLGADGAYRAGESYHNFPMVMQFNVHGSESFSTAASAPPQALFSTDSRGFFQGSYRVPGNAGTYDLAIYPNYGQLNGSFEGVPTLSRGWVDGVPQPFIAIPVTVGG